MALVMSHLLPPSCSKRWQQSLKLLECRSDKAQEARDHLTDRSVGRQQPLQEPQWTCAQSCVQSCKFSCTTCIYHCMNWHTIWTLIHARVAGARLIVLGPDELAYRAYRRLQVLLHLDLRFKLIMQSMRPPPSLCTRLCNISCSGYAL
jgi:hypothetical protein